MAMTDETLNAETDSLSTIDVTERVRAEGQAECIHVANVTMIPPSARNHLQAKADEIERAFQIALGVTEPTATKRDTEGLFTEKVAVEAVAPVDDAVDDVDAEKVAEIATEYEQRFGEVVDDVREEHAEWTPPETVTDTENLPFEPWNPRSTDG